MTFRGFEEGKIQMVAKGAKGHKRKGREGGQRFLWMSVFESHPLDDTQVINIQKIFALFAILAVIPLCRLCRLCGLTYTHLEKPQSRQV